MTASSYDEALRRVLVHEGGYSNHPSDPGGPTNWGITIHDARAYWKKEATAADVRSMPVDVAKDIYRSKYWDAMCCDNLPAGVDYAVFDYRVNSGIARATRVLQRLVDTSVDGEVGPDTIVATARANRPSSSIRSATSDWHSCRASRPGACSATAGAVACTRCGPRPSPWPVTVLVTSGARRHGSRPCARSRARRNMPAAPITPSFLNGRGSSVKSIRRCAATALNTITTPSRGAGSRSPIAWPGTASGRCSASRKTSDFCGPTRGEDSEFVSTSRSPAASWSSPVTAVATWRSMRAKKATTI